MQDDPIVDSDGDNERGDQEVRQAFRKTLYVQFQIRDDVFEKALGYVREYY